MREPELPDGSQPPEVQLAKIDSQTKIELARIGADKEKALFESQQRFRTARVTRIILGTVGSLLIIAASTIIITKPILEVLIAGIVSVALGLGAVTWIAMRMSLNYVDRTTTRIRELELKVDATRSSSHFNANANPEDGTHTE